MKDLLFSFQGRINRAKFWLASIAITIIYSVVTSLLFAGAATSSDPTAALASVGMAGGIVALVLFIAMIWISFALAVKLARPQQVRLVDPDRVRPGDWRAVVFHRVRLAEGHLGRQSIRRRSARRGVTRPQPSLPCCWSQRRAECSSRKIFNGRLAVASAPNILA